MYEKQSVRSVQMCPILVGETRVKFTLCAACFNGGRGLMIHYDSLVCFVSSIQCECVEAAVAVAFGVDLK